MTLDKQNHIRDSVTILMGVFAGADAWADVVSPVSAISPSVAHAFPFFLAAIPVVRGALTIGLRIYNTWYPPTPTPNPPTK